MSKRSTRISRTEVTVDKVEVSRKIGKAVMRINREHPLVKRLNEIVNEMSLQIVEQELKKAKPIRVKDKNTGSTEGG